VLLKYRERLIDSEQPRNGGFWLAILPPFSPCGNSRANGGFLTPAVSLKPRERLIDSEQPRNGGFLLAILPPSGFCGNIRAN